MHSYYPLNQKNREILIKYITKWCAIIKEISIIKKN